MINFTIEAFPRPQPRGVTWVRLKDNSEEEGVQEGMKNDLIELKQDVGPDMVGLLNTIFQ